MKLENWSVTIDEDPYMAPEQQKSCLHGEVFGHPRFEDGHRVRTSWIVKVNSIDKTIETTSGSIYTLGEVDPEYEQAYPNAVERLWKVEMKEDHDDFQWRVGEWAEKTFTKSTNTTIVKHLMKEIQELLDSIEEGKFDPMEAADCHLLLLHLCHREGFSLQEQSTKKHYINEHKREWGEPGPDGVTHHIKN